MAAASVLMHLSPQAAAAAGNPWGCPPALCMRQSTLQQHVTRPSSTSISWKLCAAAHTARSSSLRPAAASPATQLHRARCTAAKFAAGDSSYSSEVHPGMVMMPFPDIPDPQQQLLCDILHVQPAQADAILLACPGVSTMTAAQLSTSWQCLQQLLPLPQHMLLRAVLQVPSLLSQPQQTVAARLEESAKVLGLSSVPQLRAKRQQQTVQLHWRLLVTPPQELGQQLEQLMQVLAGLAHRHVVKLVCGEPRLLGRDPAQLLSTVEALEQICGCPLGRLLPQLRSEPRLLVAPAEGLYRAAAGLQQMLRLSEEGLTLVVRRASAALIVPAERLADLLTALAGALSVSQEVAADILLQEPELLVRSSGAVLAVLDVLRSRYKLSADSLLQVVQFDPSVLLLSAGQLDWETRRFKLLASSHPGWHAEYKYLMLKPVNVARALRIEPLRLQRLAFLSRQGLAGTISLRTALTLSGRKFVLLYPQYPAWLGQAYSRGNAPRRYAAVAPVGSSDEDSEDDSDY